MIHWGSSSAKKAGRREGGDSVPARAEPLTGNPDDRVREGQGHDRREHLKPVPEKCITKVGEDLANEIYAKIDKGHASIAGK